MHHPDPDSVNSPVLLGGGVRFLFFVVALLFFQRGRGVINSLNYNNEKGRHFGGDDHRRNEGENKNSNRDRNFYVHRTCTSVLEGLRCFQSLQFNGK